MTDGNPTAWAGDTGTTGSVDPNDVEYGVASANLAKQQSAQPKVVAIGVNNAGLNFRNLSLISGPNANDDYYLTNFSGLSNTLKEIAEELCGGSVTVIKEVPKAGGGWKVASGWTFSAASSGGTPSPTSGNTAADGTVNFDYDNTGSVTATITETVKSGFGLVQQDGKNAVCTKNGGSSINESNTSNGVSFILGPKDIVTCTFRNEQQQGTLTLEKTVINDNGGTATKADFQAKIDGNNVPWDVAQPLDAGNHTASETVFAGYTAGSWGGDCNPNGSINLSPGENATCTITNDDDAPSLILKKTVVNDNGGTEVASAWTLSAGSNDVTGSAAGIEATDQAGTYALSESSVAGYTNTSITCDDDPGAEVTDVTLGLGETITCEFVNDDVAAGLTLVKTVVNDNGGTESASAWTLSAGANDVTGSAAGVVATTQAGTYALSESSVAGYTNTSITCDDDPGAEVTDVTLGLGEQIVCTFVNDDDAPSLILKKTVVNDNGGTEVASAWTLSAGSNDVTGSAAGIEATDQAGTYALSESSVAGYTNTSITCDDDPGAEVTDVTLGLGETITCEFVNDDQPATLTLVKTVDGGPATQDDFDAFVDETQVSWNVANPVLPGSYVASEVMNVTDYVAREWGGDCDAQGNVTVELGEQLTCTITNFYAELSIEKSADPGFYAEVGDPISYTIVATNTGMATLTNVDVSDELIDGLGSWTCDPTLPATLAPGESVTCEATYLITADDIETGSVPNTACADADEISEEVCDDETVLLSQLEIVKSADVDYFSTAGDVINYTVTATNTGEATLTNVDISDDLIDGLDSWECTPPLVVSELASGESITCTATYVITADDIESGSVDNVACVDSDETPEVCDEVDVPLAQLEIEKTADVDFFTAVGDEIEYTITATNTGQATLTNVDISDELVDGLGSWSCDPGNPVAELGAGETITCTATYVITADDIESGSVDSVACVDSDETPEVCDEVDVPLAQLEIEKTADVDFFTAVGDEIEYTITATNTGQATLTNVDISDELVDGLGSWSCDPGNPVAELASGESITCTATYVITADDIESGSVDNVACVDSDETPEVCDEVDGRAGVADGHQDRWRPAGRDRG